MKRCRGFDPAARAADIIVFCHIYHRKHLNCCLKVTTVKSLIGTAAKCSGIAADDIHAFRGRSLRVVRLKTDSQAGTTLRLSCAPLDESLPTSLPAISCTQNTVSWPKIAGHSRPNMSPISHVLGIVQVLGLRADDVRGIGNLTLITHL